MECSFDEPNGLCFINGSNTLLVTDTNNHCIKCLDLENDFVSEFKLIHLNDKKQTDFVDKGFSQRKDDFVVQLNSIDFEVQNQLKLQLDLDFGQQIKPTVGAQHFLYFINPGLNIIYYYYLNIP